MSGLLRNPVNPLAANPAPQANPVNEESQAYQEAQPYQEAPAPTQAQTPVQSFNDLASEIHYPNPPQMPAQAVAQVSVQVPAALPVGNADDGFDDIEVTFSSYPRVKLEAGKFWAGTENLGDAFTAHIAAIRRVYVIRDREDQNDKDGRAIWSYDGVTTTMHQSVAAIKAQWAKEGFRDPVTRETGEACALIKDGKMAGRMVMLSIPQQSMAKLSGYHNELKLSRGMRASQVLTRVYVSDPVKAKSGTFTPWGFAYAGPLEMH